MKLQYKILMKRFTVSGQSKHGNCIQENTLLIANYLLTTGDKKNLMMLTIPFSYGNAFAHLPNIYFHYNLKSVRKF